MTKPNTKYAERKTEEGKRGKKQGGGGGVGGGREECAAQANSQQTLATEL